MHSRGIAMAYVFRGFSLCCFVHTASPPLLLPVPLPVVLGQADALTTYRLEF